VGGVISKGKRNVLGILVDIVDYDSAVDAIVAAAQQKRPFATTALAVHGLMVGVLDREHQYRLNCFDLVVPDGQPVRWALNWLHDAALRDRVYGPRLMLAVCRRAEREGLPVFLYGSTQEVLLRTKENLLRKFPRLPIAGMEPSRFGHLTPAEKEALVGRIRGCRASIVFVALGCPRQEVWAYEFRTALSLPITAVGAAFPFIAGILPQAPPWMQDRGLEWLFRLSTEPLRLWKRYLILNPMYLLLLSIQLLGLHDFSCSGKSPKKDLSFG
jgi:N-acetylglucosaminyldiphosphoundecaprenol N-acetyl-beta-D-mannosaminyltransferase